MSYNDSYNSSRRDDDYRGEEYRDDGDRRRRDDYDSNSRNNNNDNYDSSNPTSDYVPPSEQAEYGGGGRHGSDNYYDNYNNPSSYTDDDRSAALSHAQQHGASPDDDESSIFSHALDFLGGNKASITAQNDIDEQAAIGAHQAVYDGRGGEQKHSSETLGAGAALQALKLFTGGGGSGLGGGSHGAGGGGGGSSQAKLIGIAMGQASKLWNEQNGKGNVVSILLLFVILLALRLSVPFKHFTLCTLQSDLQQLHSYMFCLYFHHHSNLHFSSSFLLSSFFTSPFPYFDPFSIFPSPPSISRPCSHSQPPHSHSYPPLNRQFFNPRPITPPTQQPHFRTPPPSLSFQLTQPPNLSNPQPTTTRPPTHPNKTSSSKPAKWL